MEKKILCLHGFVQNGPLFSRKASGVRKALKKVGYDTIFLTAPVKISVSDLPFDLAENGTSSLGGSDGKDDDGMRSWWPNSESDPNHYGLEDSFRSIRRSINEDGPYDGLMGFSQGAGLVGLLCTDKVRHTILPELGKTLKFAILYSGFRAAPDFHQHYYETPITVPSLHFMGSLDTVVSEERTTRFYNSCDEKTRTMIVHPGGHFVPNSKDLVTKVIDWVQHVENSSGSAAVSNQNVADKDDENWDEFDTIGKV